MFKCFTSSFDLFMEADDSNVLLACTLLRLDETSGTIDRDDEAAGDLGVESTAVASFVDSVKG